MMIELISLHFSINVVNCIGNLIHVNHPCTSMVKKNLVITYSLGVIYMLIHTNTYIYPHIKIHKSLWSSLEYVGLQNVPPKSHMVPDKIIDRETFFKT